MTTLTEQQINQAMKDAENTAPRPEWANAVRQMWNTIGHIQETKRISQVEAEALYSRTRSIIGAWLDRESSRKTHPLGIALRSDGEGGCPGPGSEG